MTQKERMLAGLPYKAWMDGLPEERARAQRACWEFNRLPPDARAERTALLRGLLAERASICTSRSRSTATSATTLR